MNLLDRLHDLLPRGAGHPASAASLARSLGVSERVVGDLVGQLIERGELVGSACTSPAGYFICTTPAEVEIGTRHIVARAASSFRRVSRLRRAAEARFGSGTARMFELDGMAS